MEKKLYSQKLRDIVESSTIHGIPNALRAKHTVLRIFWIFNVIVKLEIVQSFNSEFPAISFCNINPNDFTIEENLRNVSFFLNESFIYEKNFNSKSCDTQMNNILNAQLPNLKKFTLSKMLISCLYDNKPCNTNNFFQQRSFNFGNCFTFNSGRNLTGHSIPVLNSKRPGMVNGLRLKLFIGAPEYQPCWEDRYGALIVVHNRTFPPLFAEEGLFIQAGSETNFILNKVSINKLPSPFSNCVVNASNRNEFDSKSYRDAFDLSGCYRQKWCLLNCSVQKATQDNTPLCNSFNFTSLIERLRCLNNLENLTNYYNVCFPECPIECDYSYFNIFKSVSSFPSYSYSQFLLSNSSFRSRYPYENITLEQVRNSVVSFNAYFDSSNHQKIDEIPESNFETLLGTLGGQLGLFLGVSFLSFAEIFEILFELLLIFLNNRKNTKTCNEIIRKSLN
ncbi:unnamed protein product [Brachionus calyciflorus]|uniref:Uncharacterized protein n=1 Tax=Brachionus calyciflorus TaxID=104777 RepID=A0A814BUH6_9BILA|nr:unnamed protein product [Brachionus calyciflorus]